MFLARFGFFQDNLGNQNAPQPLKCLLARAQHMTTGSPNRAREPGGARGMPGEPERQVHAAFDYQQRKPPIAEAVPTCEH
jgi:hypothetical protein